MAPENCDSYKYMKALDLKDDLKTQLMKQMGCEAEKCNGCYEALKDTYRK